MPTSWFAAGAFRGDCVALSACLSLAAVATAPAQNPPLAFPPAAADITVLENVDYAAGAETLRMDVYRPSAAGTHPVMIFFMRAGPCTSSAGV